ncbi:hypothetical protein BHE74_00049085, partial [Ensete ventricosum]
HLAVSLFIHSFTVEECTTPLSVPRLVSFQSARAMEREVSSSSRLVVAAAVLLLLIEPPVSPLSDEGPFPPPLPLVPPCLNPAFHDRNNAIVAWYNPGARPKRPAPGLGRAPRQRLFEVCHLEIKRGARTSRRLA